MLRRAIEINGTFSVEKLQKNGESGNASVPREGLGERRSSKKRGRTTLPRLHHCLRPVASG